MKTRRNKRSKLHYTSKKNGGGITPKYKADNVVEYIDGTEVTIIEQLSYKNGEWQYKIQFPDKSYRIIPESSIKRFIRKGDFMTVRVREHERELAAFAKEHPNWKRKSKPKAWNIESSDATSFEEHQKEARAAAARAYAKEQLRKKESREQTNRIKKKTVLTKDLRNERQTVPSVEAKTSEQPDLSKIDNMSSKNKDTRGFKWVKTLDGWAKIDESKVHEGIEELMRKSKIEEGIDESKAPEEDYEVWRRNNLSNIGVSLTEKHNLERDSNIKFTKGEEVFYHKSVDEKVLAKIVKIHYDDDEPYYTIRLQDGSEKQTIYSRLKKIPIFEQMDEDDRKKLNPKLLDERYYPKKTISPEQEDDSYLARLRARLINPAKADARAAMEARVEARLAKKALAEEVAEEMRPGETARLEALRSYLAAIQLSPADAEDVLRWTVEATRRAEEMADDRKKLNPKLLDERYYPKKSKSEDEYQREVYEDLRLREPLAVLPLEREKTTMSQPRCLRDYLDMLEFHRRMYDSYKKYDHEPPRSSPFLLIPQLSREEMALRLDVLKDVGYGNPRTSEEATIWLNNINHMIYQATKRDYNARLNDWRLWKRELKHYEIDYWMSLFNRMWRAQMNGVVENRLGIKP